MSEGLTLTCDNPPHLNPFSTHAPRGMEGTQASTPLALQLLFRHRSSRTDTRTDMCVCTLRPGAGLWAEQLAKPYLVAARGAPALPGGSVVPT